MGLIDYDDDTRAGKLAPDICLQAARSLGLAPAECVLVEDSRSGIQATHPATTQTIVAAGVGG